MEKVLVANRGEIAVRVVRACRDAGLRSVAVYAEQDRDAPFVRLADEAYALGGATAAATYLAPGRLIEIAARAKADAVHPGYGFLSENHGFAQAVIDTGLTWIGPSPEAIWLLGDKVSARAVARRVRAPLAPGTGQPVADAAEVQEFARRHGLPVAIKAAHGGGGRGLKVVREFDQIAGFLESARREAAAAFGNGDCFVEVYLDRARHVETQCLGDAHGNIAVVSTRDCTIQRRHQKLLEEAPAPFLSDGQLATLHGASAAILTAAGYIGAGTCEFLLSPDGAIYFLEVNTRLQVEHPVSEEVTGIDLVLEQFRIASGEPLGFTGPVPPDRHSLEFRLNGEDPGRNFMPAPGTVTRWRMPSGPGVRVDAGVEEGTVVDGAFDSLLAKIVVTGASRPQALARARRALAECEIGGLPTTLEAHRRLVDCPQFAGTEPDAFTVHTRWLESELSGQIEPWTEDATVAPASAGRRSYTVEVDGRRVEVVLPPALSGIPDRHHRAPVPAAAIRRGTRNGGRRNADLVSSDHPALRSPLTGTVVQVAVSEGDVVRAGDVLFVIEAMKMEQQVTAHRAGVIRGLAVVTGASVTQGSLLCEVHA
jgi:acetyl-CoA/propionyl-CoA carboxylase biotin carboxyl carrier protein